MRSFTQLEQAIAQGRPGPQCTLDLMRLEGVPPERRPTTVSPLANCIGPDALLARHMLSLADDAQAAQSTELAARFVELALELLDEAYR